MSEVFRLVRKKIANVNAQLEKSISGIRVAKAFTNEEFEMKNFDSGNQEFNKSREMAYKVMAEFFSTILFLSNFLNIVALGLGRFFVFKDIISIGDLVAYLLYISFFLQPIRRLTNFTEQLQEGISEFERFIDIMRIKQTIIDKKNVLELQNVHGKVEFKNVSFSYKEEEVVLSNIDLVIEPGKTLVLVGPSDVFLFTGTIGENILYGKPNAKQKEVVQAAKMLIF